MNQFDIILMKKKWIVFCEWYDATDAYKKFYAMKIKNGFSMYSLYDGYVLFFIEIGEIETEPQMHINYYVKYSAIDPHKIIDEQELLLFYSSIAYHFDIHNVVIYANYMTPNMEKHITNNNVTRTDIDNDVNDNVGHDLSSILFGGSYCVDFYDYFMDNKKKYSSSTILNTELYPKFSYYDLDILKKTSPESILSKEDGEIYQLYTKVYITANKKNNNIADFYLWLIEMKCYMLDFLLPKIDKLFAKNNPFRYDYYLFDPISYLYNRNYIDIYSSKFKFLDNINREVDYKQRDMK
jgi:hypothetical protein